MLFVLYFFFFKQKTAYEMRISDWSSDVCSSDLAHCGKFGVGAAEARVKRAREQDAPRNVDAAPVAVEADLGAAFGAEIGVRRPGDVAEQARRETDAAVGRRFIGKDRRNPLGPRPALRRETPEAAPLDFGHPTRSA